VKRVVEAIVDDQRDRLAPGQWVTYSCLPHELARIGAGRGAARPGVEGIARVVVRRVHDAVAGLVAAVDRALDAVARCWRRAGDTISGHAAFGAVAERTVVTVLIIRADRCGVGIRRIDDVRSIICIGSIGRWRVGSGFDTGSVGLSRFLAGLDVGAGILDFLRSPAISGITAASRDHDTKE